MSAERLREAAQTLRSRADEANKWAAELSFDPEVGWALADLLDYVSRYTSDPLDEGVAEALAVADAILGGQS